jgi:hypothetical protein
MEKENNSWSAWRDRVLAQVRFKPDRKAIGRELTDHYEDHRRDLERVGYQPALAAERALAAMGDAKQVGRALDRAHKPWLGWLWELSRVLAAALLLLLAATLLDNSRFQARQVFDRTVDQVTWQAPPAGASRAETVYETLSLAPGDVTKTEPNGYQAELRLWVETKDIRTNFPWIQENLAVTDDRGTIPIGTLGADGTWPDNYLERSFKSVSYGWTRHEIVLFLRLDHRPAWVELTYPHGGNDWVLRAEWEGEP